jgi:hypothetical protein
VDGAVWSFASIFVYVTGTTRVPGAIRFTYDCTYSEDRRSSNAEQGIPVEPRRTYLVAVPFLLVEPALLRGEWGETIDVPRCYHRIRKSRTKLFCMRILVNVEYCAMGRSGNVSSSRLFEIKERAPTRLCRHGCVIQCVDKVVEARLGGPVFLQYANRFESHLQLVALHVPSAKRSWLLCRTGLQDHIPPPLCSKVTVAVAY